MTIEDQVIKDLNSVIERLEGWAETAAQKADSLTGEDAEPWENMRNNYRTLIEKLTGVLEKLTTEVVEPIID